MKKAILYARVSTKKQAEKWTSLDDQIKHEKKFCERKWWEVVGIFKEAYTWKKMKPILREAIDEAKTKRVDFFVIFDFDRFWRDWNIEYIKLRDELFENWIILKDSKEIIQDTRYLFENDLVDMKQYNWNKLNPSEILEVFFTTYAKAEWDKILQRTIPKEIKLEQLGYQVRPANYWLKNKKIKSQSELWDVVIQIPWDMWVHLKEMFISRARWILTDKEIVNIANLNWCKKENWEPMNVKYMRELISNPIYAWIRCSKWTWYKPIIVPYEPLVSIEIWNQANKWKKIIYKYKDKVVIENNKNRKKTEKINSEEFLFRWMIFYWWKLMRSYKATKNGAIYYREWVWIKPPFNISQKNILELLWNEIEKYNLPNEIKDEMKSWIIKFLKKQAKWNDKNEKIFIKELEKIKNENKQIVKQFVAWTINEKIMKEIVSENEEKEKELEIKIIKINKQKELLSHKAVELLKLLLNTKEIWDKSSDLQKWLIAKLIWVELNFPNKKELILAENKLYKLIKNINMIKWQPH